MLSFMCISVYPVGGCCDICVQPGKRVQLSVCISVLSKDDPF